MTNIIKEFRNNLLYSGTGKILEFVLGFLATIFLVRYLSQKDYGILKVLLGIASLIGTIVSWGWPAVYQRYIPLLKEEHNNSLIAKLVKKGLITRAILTAFVIAIILIYFDEVGEFLKISSYYDYFFLFAVGIFFIPMNGVLKGILNSYFLQKEVFQVNVTIAVTYNFLLISLLLYGVGLSEVLLVQATFLTILGLWLLKTIWVKMPMKSSTSQGTLRIPKKIRKYGMFSYLNDIGLYSLDISVDTLVITKFLGPEYVALYMVGAVIPRRIKKLMPSSLLREVISPIVFTHYGRNPTDESLNRIFRFFTKINFLILIPVFLVIVFFGKEFLVFIFGDKYSGSYPYFVGLSFFFFAGMFPIGYVTAAKEIVHINAISKLIGIYNLILDIILIQIFGLLGVVIATGSANLLKNLYSYWHTKYYTKITFPAKKLFSCALISGLIMSVIKLGMFLGVIGVNVGLLIGMFGVFLSMRLVVYFRYFDQFELDILMGLIETLFSNHRYEKIIKLATGVC